MNQTTLNAIVLSAALCLSMSSSDLRGQTRAASEAKPTFTAAQKEALTTLYEHGGILIQLDEQRPGQPVVMIDFADFAGHPEFQNEWLKHLLLFPEITSVRLSGTKLTDDAITQLTTLPKLTDIALKDTLLTDVGLAQIANFKQLKTLDVRGTQVSPEGVAELRKKLPALVVEVSPLKTKLTPEQALLELKKAGSILVHYDDRLPGNPVIMLDGMNHPRFQDEWCSLFASFPQLRQIGLGGTSLSDEGLEGIAEVAKLESLYLGQTNITDVGLAKLANCKNLKYLDVEGTRVTAAGLDAIRKALPKLEVNGVSEKVGTDNVWLDGRPLMPFAIMLVAIRLPKRRRETSSCSQPLTLRNGGSS